MKRISVLLMVLLTLLAFVSCGGEEAATTETKEGEPVQPVEAPAAAKPLRVAMVCSGSLGDTGIFDMGNEGLSRAKADFGIEYRVLEGKEDPSLYYDLLKTAATQFDMVFVNPGYQFDSYLEEIAKANPDTLFVYADGVSPLDLDNIISVSYKEEEGSYLAGVMAAMMTTRTEIKGINSNKIVGFVGAMDMPTINNFLVGYQSGIAAVDPSIQVKALYVGSFIDPAKGKELAISLFDQGADIVYQAAAKSGDGVTEAARERGLYTIGVDTDKSPLAPQNVMGSMLKNVAVSFYDVVANVVNGVQMEKVQREGLSKKWVEMYFNDYMLNMLPADVKEAMAQAEADIISGKIVVPVAK